VNVIVIYRCFFCCSHLITSHQLQSTIMLIKLVFFEYCCNTDILSAMLHFLSCDVHRHLFHYLHDHHLHLLLLFQSFILNLRLQQIISSIDLFLSYRTDSTDSRSIYCFYSAQRLDLFAWCVRLSRL